MTFVDFALNILKVCFRDVEHSLMLQNGTCTKLYEVHCSDACGGRKNNYLKLSSSYSHVDVVSNSDDHSDHFGG